MNIYLPGKLKFLLAQCCNKRVKKKIVELMSIVFGWYNVILWFVVWYDVIRWFRVWYDGFQCDTMVLWCNMMLHGVKRWFLMWHDGLKCCIMVSSVLRWFMVSYDVVTVVCLVWFHHNQSSMVIYGIIGIYWTFHLFVANILSSVETLRSPFNVRFASIFPWLWKPDRMSIDPK